MKIENNTSDQAVLSTLGSRIARYRLNKNMTQQALAKEAGISLPTLQRIEQGHSTSMTNVIRILRVLRLLGNLEMTAPEPPVSPVMQVKMQGKVKLRARQSAAKPGETWSWDEKK